MTNTTHYNLKKFETADKMRPTTMNGLNDNADTIDAQLYSNSNDIGVHNYGKELLLVDGSPISDMTNVNFYRITGLKLNGTTDGDFNFSIVFFWTSGSSQYVELISKYTNAYDTMTIGKRYKYNNGTWSLISQIKTVTSISSVSTNNDIPSALAVKSYVDGQANNKVSSTYITDIWKGTQTAYDNLGTYSNTTLYLIEET